MKEEGPEAPKRLLGLLVALLVVAGVGLATLAAVVAAAAVVVAGGRVVLLLGRHKAAVSDDCTAVNGAQVKGGRKMAC